MPCCLKKEAKRVARMSPRQLQRWLEAEGMEDQAHTLRSVSGAALVRNVRHNPHWLVTSLGMDALHVESLLDALGVEPRHGHVPPYQLSKSASGLTRTGRLEEIPAALKRSAPASAWAGPPECEAEFDGTETGFGFPEADEDLSSVDTRAHQAPAHEHAVVNAGTKALKPADLQAIIQNLEIGELPPPPKQDEERKSKLKMFIQSAVSSALPALVGKAAESLPFGSVTVTLLKEISGRVGNMSKHRNEAEELAEIAMEMVEDSDALLMSFTNKRDVRGQRHAEELMRNSFASFRLVVDACNRKFRGRILRFLKAKDILEGLQQQKGILRQIGGAVCYAYVKKDARERLQRTASTPKVPRIIRESSALDAVAFWEQNEFGGLKIEVERLLDALDYHLDSCDDALVCENERVRNALSRNGKAETINAQRFAWFIKGSVSIAEAVQKHMPSITLPENGTALANVSQSNPRSKRTVRRRASKQQQHAGDDVPSINGRLRRILQPVPFGRDQVRHQQTFAEGTRQWVFDDFEKWAALPPDQKDRRVFWVKGTGGVGKSVIAAQLVKRYGGEEAMGHRSDGSTARPLIAAHFFCRHDHAERNDPRRAIATLVFRLASQVPELWEELQRVLAAENLRVEYTAHADGSKGGLEDAFSVLLANPLKKALEKGGRCMGDIFILVDALDELRPGASRQQLLRLVGKQLPSLPSPVRIVVTSRPEKDIEAFFNQLNPFTIHKQGERQRQDLELFTQQQIVQRSSLAKLPELEQKQVVQTIVKRADGVFLAARLMARAIEEADAQTKKALTRGDVEQRLGTSGTSIIDATYSDTLNRIQARLAEAAGGRAKLMSVLKQALRSILTAIVASRQPLRVQDLHEMCGGQYPASEALTDMLLSALSLLFSTGQRDVIEPLHKTVRDYLTNRDRAEGHFVDEREGHAALAIASLRVLEDRSLLDKGRGLVDAGEVDEAVVAYAIEHGHMHLRVCAGAVQQLRPDRNGDTWRDTCQQALEAWQTCFLQPRCIDETAQRQFTTDDVKPTIQEARAGFAAWLLLQVHTLGRGRPLVKELAELSGALSGAGDLFQLLAKLVDHTSGLYGANWVHRLGDENGVTEGGRRFVTQVPLTSPLFASGGRQHLAKALNTLDPVLRIPNLLAPSPCKLQIHGHTRTVTSVGYSPNGKRIVSGSDDNTVRVWDAETGEEVAQCIGHAETVSSVEYSPAGQRIMSGSDDKTVRIWDAETGEQVAQCIGHTGPVYTVGYSSDGKWIVSGGWDETLRVWDAETSEEVARCIGHTGPVYTVWYSPNEKLVVSGSKDNTVRVWDAETGEQVAQCTGHTGSVTSVACSKDGKRIVSGSDDETMRVWDAETGEQVAQCTGHTGPVYSAWYSPDGKRIVSGGDDETVRVWDAETGEQVAQCTGHTGSVTSVACSQDGKRIVSGSDDETVRVWDAETGEQRAHCTEHTGPAFSVGYRPDGKRIVSGSDDNTLRAWDAETGEQMVQCIGHTDWVISVGYSPNGKQILSGSKDKTIRVWNAETGEQVAQCTGHKDVVFSVAYSPGGKRIVSGSWDKTVRVWDAVTGKQVAQCNGHMDEVNSAGYSPDGKRIVSGSDDNTVRVWDAATGEQVAQCTGHTGPVLSVRYSPRGGRIVSGSDDETMRVWDAETGEQVAQCTGHTGPVYSVWYSPDGKRIVSGSDDETVRVWDAETGKQVAQCTGHTDVVFSVRYNPNGKQIVSGSWDETVRVWDAETGEQLLPESEGSSGRVTRTKSRCCIC